VHHERSGNSRDTAGSRRLPELEAAVVSSSGPQVRHPLEEKTYAEEQEQTRAVHVADLQL
jgi:hypothetical protein